MAGEQFDADVLIAGGGPVGMGLAIELGQRGISTLVVEKYPEPQAVPKGQNLTQRTMEHFQAWGCEAALRAARTIPPDYGIGGLTAYGSLLSGLHYDWLQRELVRPFYRTDNERLPQYATERVLRARVAELGSVETLYGWEAGEVAQEADGVTLAISERGGAGRRRLRGRYLIGCDGSRSVVRESAGISQTLSDHDRVMVLLVFHSDGLDALLKRFPGKSFYNVLHPDLEGYWQFFGRVDMAANWFFHAPVPRSAMDGGFDFEAYLHRAVGAEFDVEFQHVGYWDLRFAIADDYVKGRVFVAGDAAHSHPPYGGYGINTGFEDARNLGWKLAASLQGWGGDRLLESYHDERHAVFASTARDFIAKSIEQDRDFLATHDPAVDADGFAAEWARRATGAQTEVQFFQPNYRGSAVVCGAYGAVSDAVAPHAFRAEAGFHLAPVAIEGGTSLDGLGAGFTLLGFGVEDAAVDGFVAAAGDRGVPLTVVRLGLDAETAKYRARLVLVRPDQFVAWAGDEVVDPGVVLDRVVGGRI
jgi:2-polyprenyl-6-methoxyphenol hydroxylase-like FAD-dependent oxidoreductase